MIEEYKKEVYYIHDVECNQKYGYDLPYSFHLKVVGDQFDKFKHLLRENESVIASFAIPAHDLIEDGRMTYNDVVSLSSKYYKKDSRDLDYDENFSYKVADVVYCVTDEKGKNREQRKSDKYYKELSENDIAIFVKLCDIAANTIFSKLTNSSMYNKYKKEFPNTKRKLFKPHLRELFSYIEEL